jgi:hypothetical protein
MTARHLALADWHFADCNRLHACAGTNARTHADGGESVEAAAAAAAAAAIPTVTAAPAPQPASAVPAPAPATPAAAGVCDAMESVPAGPSAPAGPALSPAAPPVTTGKYRCGPHCTCGRADGR